MTTKQEAHHKWVVANGDKTLKVTFPLNKDSLVFDVGGYHGDWAAEIYKRYKCSIFIFEPVNSFFEKIASRFKDNEDIVVGNYGLGGELRVEDITLCEDASSLFKSGEEKQAIAIEDIVGCMDFEEIEKIDLMKINIEGGEYELLERLLSSGYIEKINHLLVQFHELDGNSEKRMWDIMGRLGSTHQPVFQYKFVWEHWKRK